MSQDQSNIGQLSSWQPDPEKINEKTKYFRQNKKKDFFLTYKIRTRKGCVQSVFNRHEVIATVLCGFIMKMENQAKRSNLSKTKVLVLSRMAQEAHAQMSDF